MNNECHTLNSYWQRSDGNLFWIFLLTHLFFIHIRDIPCDLHDIFIILFRFVLFAFIFLLLLFIFEFFRLWFFFLDSSLYFMLFLLLCFIFIRCRCCCWLSPLANVYAKQNTTDVAILSDFSTWKLDVTVRLAPVNCIWKQKIRSLHKICIQRLLSTYNHEFFHFFPIFSMILISNANLQRNVNKSKSRRIRTSDQKSVIISQWSIQTNFGATNTRGQ